jgi:hypothetical protein
METPLDSFLHVVDTLFPAEREGLKQKLQSRFESPPTALVAQALNLESLTDAEVSCNSMPLANNCVGGLINSCIYMGLPELFPHHQLCLDTLNAVDMSEPAGSAASVCPQLLPHGPVPTAAARGHPVPNRPGHPQQQAAGPRSGAPVSC